MTNNAIAAAPRVTLPDIRLGEYTLETLPRLKKLRGESVAAKPEVCIERARYYTEYLRDLSSEKDPIELRYAGAAHHFLSHKEPLFFGDSLVAGTTTSKKFGAPLYPEQTGLTIWPELDVIGTREKNPMSLAKEDAEDLDKSIFPYWMDRNIMEYTRHKYNNPECLRIFERVVFFIASKAGTISHTVPGYERALKKGLTHIIAQASLEEARLREEASPSIETRRRMEFYQAIQISLKGIIAYARNLAQKALDCAAGETDLERKRNFEEMAAICAQVPAGPSTTFREAVNALWIIQVGIHAENINMAISPGRLDQVLYPFYRQDMEAGRLSTREALEITGCLWLKINDNTSLVPEMAEELFGGAGTVPAVTLGGVDSEGNDAVNDLTYIMLRITELLQTRDPSMNARYNFEKNTAAYRNRVAEVIAVTRSVPSVHNDIAAIQTLENQGLDRRDARDFAIIGCVELASPGRSYDASSSIILNLVSPLELTLYNGQLPVSGTEVIGPARGKPGDFKTYDDFWEAYSRNLKWAAGHAVKLNEYFGHTYQERLPQPLLSAFYTGPLEEGRDLIQGGARYNSSGATHVGFADVVDSLNAIEKAVYLDGYCSLQELVQAVRDDFKKHEKLHAYLVHRTPKYGTLDPIALANSRRLVDFLYQFYQEHTNYRGGKYRPAFWTMTNHAGLGKLSGALPSGRRAGRSFSSGITPASQQVTDLGICLRAVSSLDSTHIPGGLAFNLKFPSVEPGTEYELLAGTFESYCRQGGLQVQFNIMSYAMLLDAKKHPEKYPDLLVRVSGYSAYFNSLNEQMKEEIITRAEFDLKTGRLNSFPDGHTPMLPMT